MLIQSISNAILDMIAFVVNAVIGAFNIATDRRWTILVAVIGSVVLVDLIIYFTTPRD